MTGLETVARTVYGEARGEPWAGKLAVAWVIRNRADNPGWWGTDYTSVCLKPSQFSCWLAGDPNSEKLKAVTTADPFFRECLAAAASVIGGIDPDPTRGATSYKVTLLPWPKDWGDEKPRLVEIGHHSFYRL